jgi:hypothetical protein
MPSLFDLEWSDDGADWTTAWTATSDYDTWNPFRHTFLEPVGAPAQVLEDLTGTGTGTVESTIISGPGGGVLEDLTSTGAGTGADPITGTGSATLGACAASASGTASGHTKHRIGLNATWTEQLP